VGITGSGLGPLRFLSSATRLKGRQTCSVSEMLKLYLMPRDRIYVDREETSALFRQGAKVFICGSKPMALGITAMCEKIYGEITGKSDEESKEWFKSVQADRFATDVFG
jgi:sulfite reductase alpha subunit-like flavoprotein